jgi:hypothetical protein
MYFSSKLGEQSDRFELRKKRTEMKQVGETKWRTRDSPGALE